MVFQNTDDVTLDECEDCHATHDPNNETYVTLRRLPHRTNEEVTLCANCFATEITSKTLLSDREAEVYAYATHDVSNEKIGNILNDIDRTTVASYLARAGEKFTKARRTVEIFEPSVLPAKHEPTGPTEDLTPGTVVRFQPGGEHHAVSRPEYDDCTFDHGIIKRVLTRNNNETPNQLAMYVFDPDTDTIFMDNHKGIPGVVDKSPAGIAEVLVPSLTLPNTIEMEQRLEES